MSDVIAVGAAILILAVASAWSAIYGQRLMSHYERKD